MHSVRTLGHWEARRVIDKLTEVLLQSKRSATIAVADHHGELIALSRLDGAPLSSILNAANKAWTAARERKSSADIGRASRDPHTGFDIAFYADRRYIGWGGGVPVVHDGQVLGAIGVSGLPEQEDIELAQLGVQLLASAPLSSQA